MVNPHGRCVPSYWISDGSKKPRGKASYKGESLIGLAVGPHCIEGGDPHAAPLHQCTTGDPWAAPTYPCLADPGGQTPSVSWAFAKCSQDAKRIQPGLTKQLLTWVSPLAFKKYRVMVNTGFGRVTIHVFLERDGAIGRAKCWRSCKSSEEKGNWPVFLGVPPHTRSHWSPKPWSMRCLCR